MELAKGASFRFTPRTDQRYAALLTRFRHPSWQCGKLPRPLHSVSLLLHSDEVDE